MINQFSKRETGMKFYYHNIYASLIDIKLGNIMPEMFKSLNQIFETAPQNTLFVHVETGQPQTLDDWYSDIASIKLLDSVPKEVHQHFNRAKNTMLYSWFCYEMMPVAEQYCFCVLEIAFKLLLGFPSSEIHNMNNMIQEAVSKGSITDEQGNSCHLVGCQNLSHSKVSHNRAL